MCTHPIVRDDKEAVEYFRQRMADSNVDPQDTEEAIDSGKFLFGTCQRCKAHVVTLA
jgi:hypothetical protein